MFQGIGMGYGGGFMWLIWIVLILVVLWAVRGVLPGTEARRRSPRELLDERYARGEIDEEEYHKRRTTLDS